MGEGRGAKSISSKLYVLALSIEIESMYFEGGCQARTCEIEAASRILSSGPLLGLRLGV